MAILSGKNGTLFVNSAEVTPVSNWKFVATSHNRAYAANDTGGWKRRAAAVRDAAGSFEIKATDSGVCPVAEGDTPTVNLHLDGTGQNYFEVPAIIDRIMVDVNISKGRIVAYIVAFSGNGAVVRHGVVGR